MSTFYDNYNKFKSVAVKGKFRNINDGVELSDAYFQNDITVDGNIICGNIISTSLDNRMLAKADITYVDSSIDTSIANLINSSPAALDTLNELSLALNNDPNFYNTMLNNIGIKANISYVDNIILTLTNSINSQYSNFYLDGKLALKLDNSTYDSDKINNSNYLNIQLSAKLNQSVYDTFLTANTIALNTINTNIATNTTNISNLNSSTVTQAALDAKLNTSTYNTFLTSNTTVLNGKLNQSVYDTFLTANTTALNAKLSSSSVYVSDSIYLQSPAYINGIANIAIGYGANTYKLTGTNNNVIGFQSSYFNSSSTNNSQNTYMGSQSGAWYNAGSDMTIVGYKGGGIVRKNTSNRCTLIGSQTVDAVGYSDSSALGYGSTITANNQIMLGRSSEVVVCPGSISSPTITTINNNIGLCETTSSLSIKLLLKSNVLNPTFTGNITLGASSNLGISENNNIKFYLTNNTISNTSVNIGPSAADGNIYWDNILNNNIFMRWGGYIKHNFLSTGDLTITGNINASNITTINNDITTINNNISNVNNTSDINKPVSNATTTQLNLKVNALNPSFTGSPTFEKHINYSYNTSTVAIPINISTAENLPEIIFCQASAPVTISVVVIGAKLTLINTAYAQTFGVPPSQNTAYTSTITITYRTSSSYNTGTTLNLLAGATLNFIGCIDAGNYYWLKY